MRKQRPNALRLCLALFLLWPIGLRAEEQSFAIINAGVSASEDAPFVTTEYRFLPGDAVYVSFQVAGYKVKTDATTDVREMALSYSVAMQDESGIPMDERAAGEIKEQLHTEDKNWVPKRRASFVIPALVAAGQYQIHLIAQDALGAAQAVVDVPFRIAGEKLQAADGIEVENFKFLREESSRDALAVAAYRPGDTVFTAFDIVGFARAAGNKYHVAYGIAVQGPDGKPFLAPTRPAEIADETFYPARFLPERADILTKPSSQRGPYTITLTVQDLLSHKTYMIRQVFTLE